MPHIHRFYIEPLDSGIPEALLAGQEAHHALHVVRLRKGDAVVLFDGKGMEYWGVAVEAMRQAVRVAITERRVQAPPAARLTLLQGWLHREKSVEELIRRATELGVARFHFYQAQHSERPPALPAKLERFAIESLKQCGRAWLPEFRTSSSLAEALGAEFAEENSPQCLLLATQDRPPTPLGEALRGTRAGLIVGPEGDATDEELDIAQGYGAKPISLGAATYRSEVAAVLASALALYEWGQLGPKSSGLEEAYAT